MSAIQLGKLVIFAAPSGAGKTTLVRHLLQSLPEDFAFSVSATTRAQREHEVDGEDYYFLSRESFNEKLAAGAFLEWQEVYDGNYYGTLRSEVDRILLSGKNVLFDVDVVGALNIKKEYGDQALTVFVQPPSVDHLRQRLSKRGTENEETLNTRLAKAEQELAYAEKFDTIVINDDIEIAKVDAVNTVRPFLHSELVLV